MNDQNITITRSTETVEGAKRFYAPVILNWTCKKCGEKCTRDYAEEYFMNPRIPAVQDVHLYCEHCNFGSGPYKMKLDITLELVEVG
jgi:hypothetical protein